MIKRRIILICAAILSCIAVVGVGFGYWTFDVEKRVDVPLSVYVTESASVGTFSDVTLPSVVVLDEGLNNITTITGVSFYRTGTKTVGGVTKENEILFEDELAVTFTTQYALKADEADALKFGMRVRATGKLDKYIRHTTFYARLDKQGDYIDLKAFAAVPNYDGTSNLTVTQNADGTWTFVFRFTTVTLDSFFTFRDGLRPETKAKYDAMCADLGGDAGVAIDLWQGWQ